MTGRTMWGTELTTVTLIQALVSDEMGIDICEIRDPTVKDQKVVRARHLAIWLAKIANPAMTMQDIGEHFSSMHHSTVSYGFDKIGDAINRDEGLIETINRLWRRIMLLEAVAVAANAVGEKLVQGATMMLFNEPSVFGHQFAKAIADYALDEGEDEKNA